VPDHLEALIVDFGGVLTTPLQDSMIAFSEEMGIELQDLVRVALAAYSGGDDQLVVAFETGQISEEEFAQEFATRLSNLTGGEVSPVGLVDRIFGSLRAEEDMFEIVGAARRAGYRTGLLSNSWGLRAYPRERFTDLFDAVVISGEVGMRKPDVEIFSFTAEKLAVEPEVCVFVDDHPGHLKAALELGMTTILHKTPQETIEELRGLLPRLPGDTYPGSPRR
jgi:putative hydrolase of the HAD superfamily